MNALIVASCVATAGNLFEWRANQMEWTKSY